MLYNKLPSESNAEYKYRLCMHKKDYDLTWQQVADLLKSFSDYSITAKGCFAYYNYHKKDIALLENASDLVTSDTVEDIDTDFYKVKKEKYKLQEERTQINGMLKAISREETLKEIAKDVANKLSFKPVFNRQNIVKGNILSPKAGILVLSDWHYGLEVDSFFNTYNPKIAEERLTYLLEKSIEIIKKENICELHIVNLGDLISGNIHLPLRINSRIDVITQTLEVTNLLCDFISCLCEYVENVYYYSVTDNHSRINANKKESLQIESFTRITDYIVKLALKNFDNFVVEENMFGPDIINFSVFDHNVLAVHGDLDPQSKAISQLTGFSQTHWDLMLSAHMHHFSADEQNKTVLLCNGSLIGTDDYASSLRCNSKPSQLFIVSTAENVDEIIYKITL